MKEWPKLWRFNGPNFKYMKKMSGINIDKWRVLNKTLFEAYILTYKRLKDDPSLSAPNVLLMSFQELGIQDSLTIDGYGTAYTIAREIGIYYEEGGQYILSKMAQSFIDGKLSYQDYLKHYCLNIEFLINNEVVHPFLEILEVLKEHKYDKFEIAQRCKKLVPIGSPDSVVDCLRLFLNRCVEAELLVFEGGKYKIAFSYNLLRGSVNRSNFSSIEFEQKFILGDQKNTQKNIVTNLIEREIAQLFSNSFKLITSNPIPLKLGKENILAPKKANFEVKSFHLKLEEAGLKFSTQLITRFIASLQTKPFVILTGLTGSGKTKLAQSFVSWICDTDNQYAIIPVGADWTNREPILGYPNGLESDKYELPESGALRIILNAISDQDNPYFLILDEMNLSHVERYFADFLSVMESKDTLKLYSGSIRKHGNEDIPERIYWPKNLFIIGTVNIDESTYMFSPKVLDRANVIEFRVSKEEMVGYLGEQSPVDMKQLLRGGISLAQGFLVLCQEPTPSNVLEEYQVEMVQIFEVLKTLGAEFGYRSANEIGRLIHSLGNFGVAQRNDKIDIAIMQKMLPKLHGSRTKLHPVLEQLGKICLEDGNKWKEYFEVHAPTDFKEDDNVKYKLSFEKIVRMYKNASVNGFASYAEA